MIAAPDDDGRLKLPHQMNLQQKCRLMTIRKPLLPLRNGRCQRRWIIMQRQRQWGRVGRWMKKPYAVWIRFGGNSTEVKDMAGTPAPREWYGGNFATWQCSSSDQRAWRKIVNYCNVIDVCYTAFWIAYYLCCIYSYHWKWIESDCYM